MKTLKGKTVEKHLEYREGQTRIETMSDMTFTKETLVNKLPATALLKLLMSVNMMQVSDFTDGFSISAIAQMDQAICQDAIQYKVLVSIGWSGESDLAEWNPQTYYIFTFETREGKVFNTDFVLYSDENIDLKYFDAKGYVEFLAEFSEQKIFIK